MKCNGLFNFLEHNKVFKVQANSDDIRYILIPNTNPKKPVFKQNCTESHIRIDQYYSNKHSFLSPVHYTEYYPDFILHSYYDINGKLIDINFKSLNKEKIVSLTDDDKENFQSNSQWAEDKIEELIKSRAKTLN